MALSTHCTITTRLPSFSSCDGEDSASGEYDCDSDLFKEFFDVTFYANGYGTGNRGHVSIIFTMVTLPTALSIKPDTFSCTASVIDASGNKRFPRSFSVDFNNMSNTDKYLLTLIGFGFHKYVKRSVLLSDSSDLLANNCLTLCLEIDHSKPENPEFDFRKPIGSKYDTADGLQEENDICYLSMNTEFARDLCKMSSVFRDMTTFSKDESGPGMIPIPPEEENSFELIFDFLSGYDLQLTLSDICMLYILADKYDMQQIVQLSHQLLVSMNPAINTQEILKCVDKDMRMISELVQRFEDDENLKEIDKMYSDIRNELEVSGEAFGEQDDKLEASSEQEDKLEASSEQDTSNAIVLKSEWSCKHMIGSAFEFSKIKIECLKMDAFK